MSTGLALTWGLTALLIALLALAWWRLRRAAFLALLAGVAVAALAGEAVVRALALAHPGKPEWIEPLTLAGPDSPAYWPDSELVYRYPSDPRGYFDADGTITGHINSKGLRGAECRFEKAPGTIRVAVLGDSFTLGIGVKDEDTLPARLGRELDRSDVEVLNFGVSATQTTDQVRYLAGYVQRFDPDIVVLVYFLNDADLDSTMDYLTRPRAFRRLRRYSHLVNGLVGLVEKTLLRGQMLRHYREGHEEDSESWRGVREALLQARSTLAQRGVELVVAIHPILIGLERGRYPLEGVHASVSGFCRSEGIRTIDLLDALYGARPADMWVHPNDRHPNELAHARTARELARFLGREGLLD